MTSFFLPTLTDYSENKKRKKKLTKNTVIWIAIKMKFLVKSESWKKFIFTIYSWEVIPLEILTRIIGNINSLCVKNLNILMENESSISSSYNWIKFQLTDRSKLPFQSVQVFQQETVCILFIYLLILILVKSPFDEFWNLSQLMLPINESTILYLKSQSNYFR